MADTLNRDYPRPDPSRTIAEEFPVSDQALVAIDEDVHALFQAILGLALAEHTHALANITGLLDALAGKADTGHDHSLDDLSDVSGAAAAANGYVLVKSGSGWIPGSPASVIGSHEHAITDVQNLAAALAAKAPLSSPTFTGTVGGITKAMVGLANASNTSDADKPLSTAAVAALAQKLAAADLATVAEYLSGAAGKVLSTGVWGAAEWIDLGAFTGNVSLNLDTFINGFALATGNFTFKTAGGSKKQSGVIEIVHSGGPYTASVDTAVFETAGGVALKLSTAANAKDLIGYQRLRNGKVLLSVLARGSA